MILREEVRAKYAAGATMHVLAQEYRVSTATINRMVSDIARRAGRHLGSVNNPKRIAEIIERRARGEKLREIAATLGVTRQAVHSAIKRQRERDSA
jgi:DNA-binding transcriptional regulator LsrR (DeoR family)